MSKGRLNKLSDVLGAIDTKNSSFYEGLSPEQKKDLDGNIWLTMRYASNVAGDFKADEIDKFHYLIMTHMLVNKDFMKTSEYPELQWKLLTHCGRGRKMYHELLPHVGAKKVNKKIKMLSQVFTNKNVKDLEMIIAINEESELKDLCEEYGFDRKEIDSAFKG